MAQRKNKYTAQHHINHRNQHKIHHKKPDLRCSHAQIKQKLAYQNERYALKQDKKYLEKQKLVVENEFTPVPRQQVRIKNLWQLFVFYLYIFYFARHLLPPGADASPVPAESHANDQKCHVGDDHCVPDLGVSMDKIKVQPGADPVNCHVLLNDQLKQLQTNLPETREMISRVQSQENFRYVCASGQSLLGDAAAHAYFDQKANEIWYPANSSLSASTMHHEHIHAATSQNHNTAHCNLTFINSVQLNDLRNQTILPQNGHASFLTNSPIWPPSSDNLKYMEEILKLDKINIDDAQLQKKVFNQEKLSPTEETAYQKAMENCKRALPIKPQDSLYTLNTAVGLKIRREFEQHQSIPNTIIDNNGIIHKDIQLYNNGVAVNYPPAGGTLPPFTHFKTNIEDGISRVIFRYHDAYNAFNYYIAKGAKLLAVMEIVTRRITGIPSSAVRNYYPTLFKHLENDEACCVKGEVSRCYPPI